MTKHFSPLVGKPSTGEPDAGEPHVRFGGRGGATQCVVPTPIRLRDKVSGIYYEKCSNHTFVSNNFEI